MSHIQLLHHILFLQELHHFEQTSIQTSVVLWEMFLGKVNIRQHRMFALRLNIALRRIIDNSPRFAITSTPAAVRNQRFNVWEKDGKSPNRRPNSVQAQSVDGKVPKKPLLKICKEYEKRNICNSGIVVAQECHGSKLLRPHKWQYHLHGSKSCRSTLNSHGSQACIQFS